MPRGVKKTEEEKAAPKKTTVKRVTKKAKVEVEEEYDSSDCDSVSYDEPVEFNDNLFKTSNHTPTVFIKNTALKSSDSDRLHLAHAINNFTLKTNQLIDEMKGFESFKESIERLDMQIDSKKKEYNETIEKMNQDFADKNKDFDTKYREKMKKCETEYNEKQKKMHSDFTEKARELETTHKIKVKQLDNDLEEKKREVNSKLEDEKFKAKLEINQNKEAYCEKYAKDLKMAFVKEEDHKEIVSQMNKAKKDYDELKKNFDKQCESIKADEVKKYNAQLANERKTTELTNKAHNAGLVAQLEQQKNEIKVLMDTINNMREELREQREMTKDIAKSASKAQISQTIGKN
jgi:hypothetical protein